MTEWIPARDVEDLFPADTILPPPPPAKRKGPGFGAWVRGLGRSTDLVESMPHLRLVRALLARLRGWVSRDLLDSVDRWAKATGSIALLASAVLLLLAFVICGIRGESVGLVVAGLVAIPLVTVLAHFVGAMFTDAGGSLLRESPSALASASFLDCFGLVAFLGAVAALVGGVVGAVEGEGMVLVSGVAAALVLVYVGGVSLNPESIHVDVRRTAGAGEEAIGILMFLFKLPLRLVPFFFGVGLVAAFFATAVLFWQSMTAEPFVVQMTAMPTARTVFGVAISPFVAYVVFLLLYLLVDVLRAVLVIPGKLDALRESGSE
jgi:hypothetical protein